MSFNKRDVFWILFVTTALRPRTFIGTSSCEISYDKCELIRMKNKYETDFSKVKLSSKNRAAKMTKNFYSQYRMLITET